MAIVRKHSKYSVVDAAYKRIKNLFDNGIPMYMSFSGGKDSIVLAQLVYDLIQRGEINPKQLTVNFIDEEAMYDCVIDTVKEWRKKFMMVGAKFDWYCIEVTHFNCLNELEDSESFICWDRYKKDVWIRKPPKFAIRDHPLLKNRKETYQSFLPKLESDGISMIGVRVAESVQRLSNIADMKNKAGLNGRNQTYPIYDWKDVDVWKFIKDRNINLPNVYQYMWQAGIPKNRLRVSQFFSIDTAQSLLKMNEFYPGLMEKVQRREPNAYLVALYWDTEMFRRSNKKKSNDDDDEKINYKEEVLKLLNDIPTNFPKPVARKVAYRYKNFVLKTMGIAKEQHYKRMYQALMAGDPKQRTLRALYTMVWGDARK